MSSEGEQFESKSQSPGRPWTRLPLPREQDVADSIAIATEAEEFITNTKLHHAQQRHEIKAHNLLTDTVLDIARVVAAEALREARHQSKVRTHQGWRRIVNLAKPRPSSPASRRLLTPYQ